MNIFTISHTRKNLTAIIINEEEYKTRQKAKQDAEFAEIIDLFDSSNRELTNK
ncbi:hypothetical protein [Xenorhabdus lircayensis]|uniref:Prevent-host-death protein n=1 Tax=Xenorhabdus lircayensis TaxID=2763499 RepID=A0ABS0U8P2_9GAMM|nr:hypothetical protein [Xenorhabdus lircayensis]MBI6549141.1 hypothetical protein [Xenorhabdus lircayensis]